MNTDIVPNLTLAQAIELYRQATGDIAKAFATIADAEQRLSVFGEYIQVHCVSHSCPSFDKPEQIIAGIERRVWRGIVNRMGIQQIMSIAAREQLEKQLDKGDMPPLTEENVLAMLQGMHAQLPSLAEEAIREVWEWLRPPEDRYMAAHYKSNPRFELKDCVKISGMLDQWYVKCSQRWSVNHYGVKRLDALERVFRVLEGKGAAQRDYHSDIVQAINATPFGSGAEARTPYFRVKLFKNCAIHVYFLRTDLVAEFNRVCGGMHLRGERAA